MGIAPDLGSDVLLGWPLRWDLPLCGSSLCYSSWDIRQTLTARSVLYGSVGYLVDRFRLAASPWCGPHIIGSVAPMRSMDLLLEVVALKAAKDDDYVKNRCMQL